jgi:hypothetical protein
MTAYLTHNWFLNDALVKKWGYWWNCNLIKWAKHDIASYWKYGFGTQKIRFYSLCSFGSHKLPLWMLPIRLLTSFMSSRWMVTLQFWCAIWSGLYKLSDEGKLVRDRSAEKSVQPEQNS